MQAIKLDTDAKRTVARARLQEAIARGAQNAGGVIQKVISTTPHDELQPARQSHVEVRDGVAHYVTNSGERPISSHAFGQLTSRAGMRTQYARDLLADSQNEPWKAELLQHSMREHLQHSDSRFLVRSIDNQVRGVLSDSYKRMDSRPLLDAFIQSATAIGAKPYSGHATETRCAVRCIVPEIVEPTPGEMMVFGLNWQNSDFGAGSYTVSLFALRLVCLNGMVGENALKKAHFGSRLSEGDVSFSSKTYQLDQSTLVSATSDAVASMMSESKIRERSERIRAAAGEEATFEALWKRVGKNLTKADRDATRAAYEGPDQLNMPEGQTTWRFANALSWVANSEETPEERKLDLQHVAGQLVAA